MFSSRILAPVLTSSGSRNFATLKEISVRLKSVKNIQKITKSMQMVSAAKYARAERELKPARSYGQATEAFFERSAVKADEQPQKKLIIALTSDRGLCGGVHANVVKNIRAQLREAPENAEFAIIGVGDKCKAMLQREHADKFLYTFNNVGKKPPTFLDACIVAQIVLDADYKFDKGEMLYNRFKTVVSYRTTPMPIYSQDQIARAEKISLYDSVDDETLRCYNEFTLASQIFFGMKEGATSEQSSRMTAMDAASKNAGEMIDKLTLKFNRTRQSVITKELIEIISGAAAV